MGSDETREGGDATAGFRVVREVWAGTIRVEGWGFWSAAVAEGFETSASEACRTAGSAFAVFVDFGRLAPQGPHGQTALQTLVNASREANATQGVVFVTNAVTEAAAGSHREGMWRPFVDVFCHRERGAHRAFGRPLIREGWTVSEVELVKAASDRFYVALDALCKGEPALMVEAWHHSPRATISHPMGEWAEGWDQIHATWLELAKVISDGGVVLRGLKIFVYGDIAYTTAVEEADIVLGGRRASWSANVTNIFHREGGVWKIIHHHADKAPSAEKAIDALASED